MISSMIFGRLRDDDLAGGLVVHFVPGDRDPVAFADAAGVAD